MADTSLRLRTITRELLSLPSRRDSDAERGESAGRLLLAAIDLGAFSGPEHASLLPMIRQRAEQKPPVNGPISAFTETAWRLAGQPENAPDFARGCELVADAIDREAERRGGGNSPLLDPPLSEREGQVYRFIRDNGAKTGKEIAIYLGVDPKSLDRPLRTLKKRGLIKNRPSAGYYVPPRKRVGMTPE